MKGVKILLLLPSLLLIGCFPSGKDQNSGQHQEQKNEENNDSSTPQNLGGESLPIPPIAEEMPANQMTQTVESLQLAAGEEKKITSDKLVLKNGVEIHGKLTFEIPANFESSEVTLEAENGDIMIDGELSVTRQEPPQEKISLFKKYLSLLIPSSFAKSAFVEGTPYVFSGPSIIVSTPNGDIKLTSNAWVKAGDGNSYQGVTLNLKNFQPPPIVLNGGDGGSVSLSAPNGLVTLDGSPKIKVGNGGDGESVQLDDDTLTLVPPQVSAPQIYAVSSGLGGSSGQLSITARGLHFSGSRGANPTEIEVEGGKGGKGGNVICHFSSDQELKGVEIIQLVSGPGGRGLIEGGDGGHINCTSTEDGISVNVPGEKTTKIVAIAAGGGSIQGPTSLPNLVDCSPGGDCLTASIHSLKAGNGGYARVMGFKGASGFSGKPASPGMHAGEVDILYGDGGHVVGDPAYLDPNTRAGNGGMTEEIGNASHELTTLGTGGAGGDGCDYSDPKASGPGGKGGNGGILRITAGKGGEGGIPGKRGNIYQDLFSLGGGGLGGSGSIPGDGGGKPNFIVSPSQGSVGTLKGNLPQFLEGSKGSPCYFSSGRCGDSKVQNNEGEECDEGSNNVKKEETPPAYYTYCNSECKRITPEHAPGGSSPSKPDCEDCKNISDLKDRKACNDICVKKAELAPPPEGSNWEDFNLEEFRSDGGWSRKKATRTTYDVAGQKFMIQTLIQRTDDPDKNETEEFDCIKKTVTKKDSMGYETVKHYDVIGGCPVQGYHGTNFPSPCDGPQHIGPMFNRDDGDMHTWTRRADGGTYTYSNMCTGCGEKNRCSCVEKIIKIYDDVPGDKQYRVECPQTEG